ncbi:hypothetical protein NDN08_006958 [Rhodosorus marinus]|uniref:Centrosomal protein of 70 kDa n=1 Tax=Rhodosorus marinus TaxID=101924 RepID=A0AAV8UJ69_9RHOD|nr:hypothetical protein NDN08_006958 [Rhodosorus marinus]
MVPDAEVNENEEIELNNSWIKSDFPLMFLNNDFDDRFGCGEQNGVEGHFGVDFEDTKSLSVDFDEGTLKNCGQESVDRGLHPMSSQQFPLEAWTDSTALNSQPLASYDEQSLENERLRCALAERDTSVELLQKALQKMRDRRANTKALLGLYNTGKEKIAELAQRCEMLTDEKRRMQEENLRSEREIRTMRLRIQELTSSRNAAESQVLELRRKRTATADSELTRLSEDREEALKRCKSLEAQVAALREEKEEALRTKRIDGDGWTSTKKRKLEESGDEASFVDLGKLPRADKIEGVSTSQSEVERILLASCCTEMDLDWVYNTLICETIWPSFSRMASKPEVLSRQIEVLGVIIEKGVKESADERSASVLEVLRTKLTKLTNEPNVHVSIRRAAEIALGK